MTKYNVIPKNIVMEAYLQVKRNGGSAGADGVSLDLFKKIASKMSFTRFGTDSLQGATFLHQF